MVRLTDEASIVETPNRGVLIKKFISMEYIEFEYNNTVLAEVPSELYLHGRIRSAKNELALQNNIHVHEITVRVPEVLLDVIEDESDIEAISSWFDSLNHT